MNNFKTNQHLNFSTGLPVEYYDQYIKNAKDPKDVILINLNRLFRGINSSDNPKKAVVDFVNYILEVGEDLLPCIIEYYVLKFKSLPPSLQVYALENTRQKNNYFRDGDSSDKIAFFANSEEYRSRSSSVQSDNMQDPEVNVSEYVKNKISPVVLKETIRLSKLTEDMIKLSQGTNIDQSTYNTISNSSHNNFQTITPTTNHLEAAKLAKTDIEANSYKKFEDCYRVKRLFKFKHNPYNADHRIDNTAEYIADSSEDIVGDEKIAVYTRAGNIPLKGVEKVHDLHSIMPLSREKINSFSKTDEEEKSPNSGSSGNETTKLNNTGGKKDPQTYDAEKIRD